MRHLEYTLNTKNEWKHIKFTYLECLLFLLKQVTCFGASNQQLAHIPLLIYAPPLLLEKSKLSILSLSLV